MAKQQHIDNRTGSAIGNSQRPRLLTIGMANHADYPGFAFTMINLMHDHPEVAQDVEFLVLDNAPDTGDGKDVKRLMDKVPNGHYCSMVPYKGTMGAKEAVIRASQTEYVMVIDSHIHIPAGAIAKTVRFLKSVGLTNDLFHGPMLNESGEIYATHMNPAFSGGNFGRWGTFRDNGVPIDNCDYYQVPAHGMGLFMTRRDTWPGFNPAMHQFGSEEGYIHEKFRLLGRKCWSLPFLKWWHLFKNDSVSLTYPISAEHKYRNQLIAFTEISLDLDLVHKHWEGRIGNEKVKQHIRDNVASLGIKPLPRDPGVPAFLGYPIRFLDPPHSESESYTAFERPMFYGS